MNLNETELEIQAFLSQIPLRLYILRLLIVLVNVEKKKKIHIVLFNPDFVLGTNVFIFVNIRRAFLNTVSFDGK